MTESELKEFLKQNHPAGEFTPYVSLHHGTLTVYFKDDADYTERLTDEITLCRSLDTKEIVGCHVAVEMPSWKPKPDAPGWWWHWSPIAKAIQPELVTAERVDIWKRHRRDSGDRWSQCVIPEPPEKT